MTQRWIGRGTEPASELPREDSENEVTSILEKAQNELTELSMAQAVEIGKASEEYVFSMLREEEQIEKFYQEEIHKIERQLGENSPTKAKIVQKLNEKKQATKAAAMKKVDDAKAAKLAEINSKYDALRAEKMKASGNVLKQRLFTPAAQQY